MRAANVADDIVVATTGWNRDGHLKHPREDNFVDFDHGTTLIMVGDSKYVAEVVVGITKSGEAVFYDVVDMTPTEFDIKKESLLTNVTTHNAPDAIKEKPSDEIISPPAENVNREISSLSQEELKSKQLDIIVESNPANNTYSTWIRDVSDIRTFEETLQDSDWYGWEEGGFDPDYTPDMVKQALDSGNITVYSSYPIEQGVFVTPSRMEAQSYSSDGKVYSKTVALKDVDHIGGSPPSRPFGPRRPPPRPFWPRRPPPTLSLRLFASQKSTSFVRGRH